MELEPLDFDPFPTTAATAAPKPAPTLEPIDFDPFPVAASQPEPQGWYESTAQTARDSISKSAVGRGFTAGLLQENPDNLGNAVEGFGHLAGSTWAIDQGKAIQDWAKTAGGVSKQGAGVLDSDSLDSFLTNVGETFGSGVASTVPSVVAGLGGAAVGSVAGPVGAIGGGVVGAGSASYVQSFGELYGALKEAGVDPQRAAELSKYGAVPIASLDMIGLGGMAKPFIGEARREIVHGLARRIATEAAKGATTEGITEAAQEFLKDATVTYETGRPLFTAERAKGWAEAGIGGALVGGAVDAGAGFRRPEASLDWRRRAQETADKTGAVITVEGETFRPARNPNAPDPNLPPPKPGDIESPIPTADIQRGRAMMDALIEGRMEEAMGLGRPGQPPAPADPAPAPAAPMPEPAAPRGYEPLYDDEDPELQVGWINPRTGDVRGLTTGASNEGTAAAPEPVPAAEAASPLERPAPGNPAAPVSEGLKTNSSSPSAPEDEFGQMLTGRPTAADVRRIGVGGAATGGMVQPTIGKVVQVQRSDGRTTAGTVVGIRQDGKVEVKGDLGGKVAVAPEAIVDTAPAPVAAAQKKPKTWDETIPTGPVAKDEPPLAENAFRLYRGEGGVMMGSVNGGRWFTTSRQKAERFAEGGGRVVYVDIDRADRRTLMGLGQGAGGADEVLTDVPDILKAVKPLGEAPAIIPPPSQQAQPAPLSTTPEPQKSATDRVPEASAVTTPLPAETKIEKAKRRAREMVAEGKTTGDIQRTLRAEGASNVEVTAATREAVKAMEAAEETATPKPETPAAKPKNPKLVPVSKRTKEPPPRRAIGENRFGQPVFEDERGVRSYVADGIRMTESGAIAPDGSVSINTGRRSESFKTKDEVDRETSGENARPLADRIADFKRDGRTWAEVLYELGYRGRSTDEQNEILRLWNRGKTGEAQARPQPKSPAKVREDALATGAPPVEDDRERQRQENIRALDERAMIPDGFELGAVRKLDKFDVSGTTRTVGDFKAVVRRVAPFGTFDGYGQTREEAIKDALRQAQAFRSTNETAQEPAGIVAPTRDVQDRSDLYAGQLAKAERALKQLRSRRAAIDETGKDPLNPNRSASLARGFLDDDISNKENTIKNLRHMLEKAGRLPSEARSEAVDSKPAKPEPLQGYSDKHPDWATSHEQDVGGKIVYSDDDMALLEGFSQINGRPVFLGVDRKTRQRTRVDIEGYTGPVFSAERKAALVEAKARQVAADEAAHAARPDGPFRGGAKVAASDSVPEAIVSIARDWLKMLGIEARVFITTLPDANSVAQADKHGLYGPFAAVRSAGVDKMENGSTRRLANGDHYIALDLSGRRSAQLETLAHEIGHILEKEVWKTADPSTKQSVVDAYKEWLQGRSTASPAEWVRSLRAHTVGKLTPIRADATSTASDLPPYWSSFSEWFADQVSRWAVSAETPVSVVDRFFSRIARGLRRLYASAAGKKLLPTSAMQTWLDARAKENTAPLEATPVQAEPAPAQPPAPKPENPLRAVFDDELDAIFGKKEPEPAPAPAKPRTARAAAKSAAKNTAMGLDEIAKGLNALFGGDKLSSGLTFDEETYAKAKPMFIAGARKFAAAGQDIADVLRALVRALAKDHGLKREAIENMWPYMERFTDDVRSGTILLSQEADTDGRREDGRDLGQAREPEAGAGMAPGQPDGDGSARNLGEPSPEDAGAPQGAPGRRGSGSRSRTPRSGGQKGEPQTGDAPNGRLGDGGAGVAPDGAGDGGHPRTAKQPASTRPNYHVADPDSLIGGTPKVRFARNRAAIEAFQAISEEGRDPTQEELDAMAAYIGWGSFGQELFQGTWERPRPRDGWQNEDRWLREHLGRDQWESAQNSIINAHYTDPPTVKAMWDMVARMGFKGGRVLEPSMGIGNFFGMMPRDLMAKSDLTGIELDKLTGGMAKLLYPQANISIKGYQESRTPDGFYDLVIGNWPFAADGPADRRYNNLSPSLHDYFFLKALDQTRPGGLVVGITSAGTMDKAGRSVRIELARKAELVAAFRLPSGAFEKYAGTAVVTDIIVLKKREAPAAVTGETWVDASVVEMPGGEIRVNDYFLANPQNVLGRLGFGHGTTYGRAGMVVERPADFMERLVSLPERLPEGVYEARVRGKEPRFVSNNTTDRTGSIVVKDGALYQVQGERLALLEDVLKYRLKDAARTAAREDQLKRLVDLRRKYGALIDAEREGKDDTEALRTALRKAYEGFKAAHGTIRDSDGLALMAKAKDSYASAVEALERQDGTPAKILREPTVRSRKRPEKPSIRDAFVIVRNETRAPDIEQVAKLAGTTVEAVTEDLLASKAIYRTPGDGFEVADVYLSGNVRRKLREAQAALEQGEDMQASIDALSKVMPKDIPYFQIEAKMGATWIDPQVYRDFIASLLGVGGIATTDVRYSGGYWKVRFSDRSLNRRPEAEATWGMREYAFDKLLNAAMNNLTVKIMTKDADGNDVVDTEANKEAAEKIMKIREEFTSWVWKDAERRVALEHSYNEVMNAVAIPQFDGSFLEFPGMALKRGDDPFSLRSHQVNAIWRGIANQRGLYAHEVGTGKTYTMAGIAVESRRYGLAKKPLLFAHNANSATVAREINDMYPGAAVLYVDNLSPDTVETTMRRIANEDWDVVVMPHSLIDRMSMKEETLMELAKEEIAALEQEAIEAAKEDGIRIGPDDMDDPDAMKKVRSPTAKDLVKQRNRIIEKIREWAMKSSRENSVAFEDLGVDMVIVDEAHEFKKPPIATRMRLRGLNTSTSNRSIALNFLTGYVKKMNGGKGVHVFTGTPITNTLTEIFNMMRFVMSDQMQLDGVANWDAWFNTFADSSSDVELTPTGEYEPITRLAAFVNVAELRRMAGQYMDTVFADDMPEFKPRATKSGKTLKDTLTPAERDEIENGRTEKPVGRPYKRIINDVGPMGEAQRATLETLIQRSRAFRAASPKERRTMLLQGDPRVPIRVESDAANAGLDPRLFDMEAADEETSKVNRAVRNLLSIYNSDKRATQVVFMEMGFSDTSTKSGGRDSEGNKLPSKKVARFNLAKDIVAKLVDGGVPRDEIAIVDGGTSKEKRREIADKMNASKIRIVIGNTDTLGVGVNMQVNLRAMHHLDAPWMPGELEQRNGRGHRQGNKWNTVLEYRYITEKLDGRRWQVLMVKDRFIKAFLKADDSVRVIEGDAVSTDEADADIAATLSEAAGDPRLLIMNKLSADIAKLENRERTHSFGVADAKSRARRVKEEIQSIKELLPAMRANAEHVAAIQKEGTFTATVGGTTYTDRKEAQEAIDTIVSNIAVGEKPVIAQIQGFEVRLDRWPVGYFANGQRQPVFKMQREGLDYDISTASVQSVAGVMRGLAKRVTDAEAQIVDKQASIGRLNEAADAPFAQQATLDKKQKMLADVRADLAANPVPPPPWLRVGAPVGTEVFVDGEKRVVEGHRWTADGYLVVTEAGDVDYLSVRDANGVRLYEARPFVAPEIIEKPPGAEAPGPERKRPQAAPRSGRPSADILSRIDGMEFSEASPAGWDMVDAGPVPRLTEAELDEIGEIIARVSGLETFRRAETIPIPANSPGAKAWGRTEAGRASAFYSGVSDTVTIALDMPEGAGRRVAYHEAFHRLQRLYLTTKEQAVLLAEGDRLRAIIAASMGRGRAVADRMAQSEVGAEAFSLYTVAKESGGQAVTGFPLRVRMAFAKIDRIVRAVRNWLNGRGFQTYEDVFDRAAEGRTALRTARGITGTTVMDDFSMIDDTDTEEDSDLDFGAPRRSMGQALFARNASLFQRVRGAANWDSVSETMDRWRYAVQDIVIDLKQVQREIVEILGPLAESQNPYLAYELSESRAGYRLETLHEDMVSPMLARMKAAGISIEDLGEYLYAKHAPERNARIAEINPKIPEGGSGMTDEEAASIVDRVESGPKARDYAHLASLVYEINDFALQTRLEAGLLSEEQADAWRQSYKFYVSLRGFAEMDPEAFEDRPNLGGSGVNVRGKESQRALGRESRAADIVAHAIMQAQEAIARAERNKVGQALYELAKAAPNREFWRADPVKTKAVWNKKLQQVVYQRVHALSRTEEDHTVFLKIGGQEHRVSFNMKNPRARRLAEGMRRLKGKDWGAVVRTFGMVNRYLSTVNTTLSPEFIITNAFKDLQTAMVNIGQYDVEGIRKRTLKHFGSVWKGLIRLKSPQQRDEWKGWHDEFIASGGRTYWNDVESVQEIARRLEAEINPSNSLGARSWRGAKSVFKVIETANNNVENAIRLAAFRAARESGMSPAMAASLAKNLTVNFNRRGAYGPLINSLYLFFNAGIQGTAVILGAMRSPQVRKIVGGIVVTGAMVALFNSLAGDDDEDGEAFYDKIPDETRQKNIIIMIPGSGGRYIKIPMPWGYNAFFGVGRVAVETAFGRKPLDAAADVMTGFIDAFNPIGGAQSLLKMISPTITDPIVDLAMNRDFADRPIAPDQKSFGADVPNAQRFWNSVGPGWRMVTDFLTTVSGGDKVRPGAIDLSPEWLEYLFGVATGSAGQFAGRTVNSAAKMMDPTSDWTVNDVPFARRVLGSKAPWVDKAAFFERLHDVEQQKAYLKRYAEAGDTAGRDAVVAESRDKLGLEKAAHASQKAMADIRRARDAVWKQKDRGQIDDAAYRERIQALKDREQEIVTRFNRIWLERIEKPRPE